MTPQEESGLTACGYSVRDCENKCESFPLLSFSVFVYFLHYHVYPLAQRWCSRVYVHTFPLNTDPILIPPPV